MQLEVEKENIELAKKKRQKGIYNMKTNFCNTVYDDKNGKLYYCRQNEIAECDNCGKLFPLRKKQIINNKIFCPICFEKYGTCKT